MVGEDDKELEDILATHKVIVFDSSDESLKIFGELLSNDTSRKIIKALIDNPMYTNEMATKLDMRVNLVIHHVKKMVSLGLLDIEQKPIVRKGINRRHFRMAKNLFISPSQTREELEESGILKKIFKEGVKFVGVIIAIVGAFSIPTFSLLGKVDLIPHEKICHSDQFLWPMFLIIIGLVVDRIVSVIKRKKG